MCFLLFFQAEDGIRDGHVTGVQTCALPISWGTEAVDTGLGGSIPFIADLLEVFPRAEVLVTGVEDPESRAHGIDESLHLGEFAKVCLAEALLLRGAGALDGRGA